MRCTAVAVQASTSLRDPMTPAVRRLLARSSHSFPNIFLYNSSSSGCGLVTNSARPSASIPSPSNSSQVKD